MFVVTLKEFFSTSTTLTVVKFIKHFQHFDGIRTSRSKEQMRLHVIFGNLLKTIPFDVPSLHGVYFSKKKPSKSLKLNFKYHKILFISLFHNEALSEFNI